MGDVPPNGTSSGLGLLPVSDQDTHLLCYRGAHHGLQAIQEREAVGVEEHAHAFGSMPLAIPELAKRFYGIIVLPTVMGRVLEFTLIETRANHRVGCEAGKHR
jgi:hypothetical protein